MDVRLSGVQIGGRSGSLHQKRGADSRSADLGEAGGTSKDGCRERSGSASEGPLATDASTPKASCGPREACSRSPGARCHTIREGPEQVVHRTRL